MKTTLDLKLRPFDVHIPNLEGDGVAEIVRIEVPVHVDPESGEEILAPEAHDLIEKTKARRMGLMSASDIRELRERLDVTQDEMSELLQIGAKTYTRWESGRARLSRSMNVLLSALRDGVITPEYLRCLRDGRDWLPLIDRRLRNSIVFVSHSSRDCRPLASGVWAYAWAALKSVDSQQSELELVTTQTRRHCPREASDPSHAALSAWIESLEAA